jgi:hypothetical protein
MQTIRSMFLEVVLAGALAGCGGSTDRSTGAFGGGSVNGTVAGSTFSVAGGLASDDACPYGGDASICLPGVIETIYLENQGGSTCPAAPPSTPPSTVTELRNFAGLRIGLVRVGGLVATGTYEVQPPGNSLPPDATAYSAATFVTTTSACETAIDLEATSGTITLTEVTSSRLMGGYSFTFGSGTVDRAGTDGGPEGSFSGVFDVPRCAGGGIPPGWGPPATLAGSGEPLPVVVCQ